MEVEFTVGLRDPISYSLIWFLCGLAVMAVFAVTFSLFWWRYRRIRAGVSKEPKIVKPPKIVLPFIKQKYQKQLTRLQQGLAAGQADTRVAYQELSRIIRMFAFEATRIEVQNYSYGEIYALNIPQLTALVQEYYEPEFARNAQGDLAGAFARTGQVIGVWR